MAINIALGIANPGLLLLALRDSRGGGGGPDDGDRVISFVCAAIVCAAMLVATLVSCFAFGLWGLVIIPVFATETLWTVWSWRRSIEVEGDFTSLVFFILSFVGALFAMFTILFPFMML